MLNNLISTLFFDLMFFGIPVIAVILFVVSLRGYLKAKRKEKEAPGSFTEVQLRSRLTQTIILGVIAGFVVLVFVGILALAYMAVAYM